MSGNFGIDLTYALTTFHIGKTRVEYQISCSPSTCNVKITLFARDGYWDPNFISEKIGFEKPDGKGPNLEFRGGTPYSYLPHTVTYTFPNPGYTPNTR